MTALAPILELTDALAADGTVEPCSLTLAAGELVLVHARDPVQGMLLADLCSGLLPLERGTARFLGHDWAELPAGTADALRGRIGRVFGQGGWLDHLGMDRNILLPQMHHTRLPEAALREAAARLAAAVGLPGLPLARPGTLHPADLARAGLVRALLNDPVLLLLENPLQERFMDLLGPLLNGISAARERGAAVMWLSASDEVWRDGAIPATSRLRLDGTALRTVATRGRVPA